MRALVPNSFLPSFMAGEILLSSSGTYTVTLLTNTSAISDTTAEASWSTLSAVSAYVSSGASQKTLQNPRLVSDVSDIAYSYFTGDSVQWTSATFTTDAAVISDVNNKIIAIARYTEQVLSSETLTLNFNDLNGILRINNNELSITQHSHAIADVVGLTSALDGKSDITHTVQSHYGVTSASPGDGQTLSWSAATSSWVYITPSISSATYHSSLLGLDADDHAQYLTSGRADLVYSHIEHSHQTSAIIGLDDEISSITCAISTKEPVLSSGTSAQYYRGDKTWQTLDKSAVGLSNVDDTADLDKPVSSAVSAQLNLKQDQITTASSATFYAGDKTFRSVDYGALTGIPSSFTPSSHNHTQSDVTSSSGWITSALSDKEAYVSSGTSAQYYRGDKTWQTLDKSAVGLGNVDNISDLNKPVSSAVQNALNLKQDIISTASSATFYAGNKSFKSVSYNVLSDVPSTFTPSSHQHNQSDVTSSSGWVTSALAGKEAVIASGTSAQYYRGDKTWQTLDTKALSDVSSAVPTDGQALVYSSAVGKYVPGTVSTSGGSGTTDHHALTNLTTYDDHPQYLTSGRADLRYLTSASEIPQAQIVSASGWMSSALTSAKTIEDIVSTVDIGAITVGQSITSGTTITDFIKSLLMKTYYPTFSAPSAALTSNLAASVESGTLSNVTLTMTLNRGSILGKLVSGTWSSATQQDYRAGTATQYIISGTNTGTTNNRTISNYTVVDSTNTWSASVDYGVGPQPTDSLGANYSTPLSSGTLSNSVTVYGRRKAFYGTTSATDVPYTLSSEIRALSSSLLNPANGSTFTISIPVGAKMVVFAYPNTLQTVSSVKYVEGLNAEIKSIFNLTNINVEGLNGYSALSYKVYTYVPASPFSATATYNVTI